MKPAADPEIDAYADAFVAAVVAEIKTAMRAAGVPSSRALARLIGRSSQYVSQRLDGGSARTGRRVEVSVPDVVQICLSLGTDPLELLARASEMSRATVRA